MLAEQVFDIGLSVSEGVLSPSEPCTAVFGYSAGVVCPVIGSQESQRFSRWQLSSLWLTARHGKPQQHPGTDNRERERERGERNKQGLSLVGQDSLFASWAATGFSSPSPMFCHILLLA